MITISAQSVANDVDKLTLELGEYGFEYHPFKIGWYNMCVKPQFRLNYDDDVIAILVISTPAMFENSFIPYLKIASNTSKMHDPIDECMIFYLRKIADLFPSYGVEIIHDFEVLPSRRPKVLVQTAAHVSGAAYLYQQKNVKTNAFQTDKVYGVCIHPDYGGWFALRGIAILCSVCCPDLAVRNPKDVVSSESERAKLLCLYNYNWKDWSFRDIIPAKQKYSIQQMRYFSTVPSERKKLIAELMHNL